MGKSESSFLCWKNWNEGSSEGSTVRSAAVQQVWQVLPTSQSFSGQSPPVQRFVRHKLMEHCQSMSLLPQPPLPHSGWAEGGMGWEGWWDWGVLPCLSPRCCPSEMHCPAVKAASCPAENLPVRTPNYFFKIGKNTQATDWLSSYIIYFFLTALPIHKVRQKGAKYLSSPWGLTSQRERWWMRDPHIKLGFFETRKVVGGGRKQDQSGLNEDILAITFVQNIFCDFCNNREDAPPLTGGQTKP